MSTVRVTCLLCEQPVQVPASEIVLHLEGTTPDAVNRYGFTCPGCAVYIVRRATRDVVDALLATDDVEVTAGQLAPWERGERPGIVLVDAGRARDMTTATDAAPITEADVLLFRKALEDDAILAAWLAR